MKRKQIEMEMKRWEEEEQIRERMQNVKPITLPKFINISESIGKSEGQDKNEKSVLFICSICKRKFRDEDQLKNHERVSDMHRDNLKLLMSN